MTNNNNSKDDDDNDDYKTYLSLGPTGAVLGSTSRLQQSTPDTWTPQGTEGSIEVFIVGLIEGRGLYSRLDSGFGKNKFMSLLRD